MPPACSPVGPLTAERLKELFHYNPETGEFTRLLPRGGKVAGDKVGALHPRLGYLRIGVDKRDYEAHRLAWLYMTGAWPEAMLDHINNVRSDNRRCNLRAADRCLNNQNLKKAKKSNKSCGLLGVTRSRTRWVASIYVDKKSRHIGVFPTAQLAHEAYLAEKRRLHPGCTI